MIKSKYGLEIHDESFIALAGKAMHSMLKAGMPFEDVAHRLFTMNPGGITQEDWDFVHLKHAQAEAVIGGHVQLGAITALDTIDD